MKVQIEENLYIESNPLCFQVVQYSIGKDKDKNDVEVRKVSVEFTTVKSCVKWIALNMKVKESTAPTLKELIAEIDAIEKYVEEKINF